MVEETNVVEEVKEEVVDNVFDDKDQKGLEDEYYAKIMFVYPPKEGPTAGDGISSSMWRESKDMSGELLTKLKRNNKIFVEFNGSASIVRAD